MGKFLVTYKVFINGKKIKEADRTILTKGNYPSSAEIEAVRQETKQMEDRRAEVVYVASNKLEDD